MGSNIAFPSDDPTQPGDLVSETEHGTISKRNPRNNAATGASAAGARALSAQFVAFYFRAPVKAFFRTRVEYVSGNSIYKAAFVDNF